MSTRNLRVSVLLLAAASIVLLAPQCGDPPPPPPTPCTIRFETPTIVPITPSYYVGWADVLIETEEEIQAYDMTISWDSPALNVTQLSPHAEFDDDSKFSMAVNFNQGTGTTSPVVDIRHGSSVTGTTRVASIVFAAYQGLPGSLSVTGTVARPDGSLIEITASEPVTTP
jgi:hypothetical protein